MTSDEIRFRGRGWEPTRRPLLLSSPVVSRWLLRLLSEHPRGRRRDVHTLAGDAAPPTPEVHRDAPAIDRRSQRRGVNFAGERMKNLRVLFIEMQP